MKGRALAGKSAGGLTYGYKAVTKFATSCEPTIRREELENSVLNALEHHLMDPEAVEIFCQEYAAERNRLQAQADAGRAGFEKELRQVTADHKKLVDAIIPGVPAEQVKDRKIELDVRCKELERVLSAAPAPDPVRFHPSMAKIYRQRVGQLIRGLSEAEGAEEAKEALRALVEKIVLVPVADQDGGSKLAIDVQGALAGLLCLATGQPLHKVSASGHANAALGASHQAIDIYEELALVAGTGVDHNLQSTPVKMVAGARNHLYRRSPAPNVILLIKQLEPDGSALFRAAA